eukprot:1187968-Prorocentrum_minimum.AAC.1
MATPLLPSYKTGTGGRPGRTFGPAHLRQHGKALVALPDTVRDGIRHCLRPLLHTPPAPPALSAPAPLSTPFCLLEGRIRRREGIIDRREGTIDRREGESLPPGCTSGGTSGAPPAGCSGPCGAPARLAPTRPSGRPSLRSSRPALLVASSIILLEKDTFF